MTRILYPFTILVGWTGVLLAALGFKLIDIAGWKDCRHDRP